MNGSPSGFLETSAFVVTNLIKLGGLVLALGNGLSDQVDIRVLAVATVMMAGAQSLESLFERLFK
jgi:hypothetical protein